MNKGILIVFALLLPLSLFSCRTNDSRASGPDPMPLHGSAEGKVVRMITDNTETLITLNGSDAASSLYSELPLTMTLIERNGFAKGMTLPDYLAGGEPTTRSYEIGDFGYWEAGPDLAVFYDDIYERTVVPVIPMGHSDYIPEAFRNETGTVRLEAVL